MLYCLGIVNLCNFLHRVQLPCHLLIMTMFVSVEAVSLIATLRVKKCLKYS